MVQTRGGPSVTDGLPSSGEQRVLSGDNSRGSRTAAADLNEPKKIAFQQKAQRASEPPSGVEIADRKSSICLGDMLQMESRQLGDPDLAQADVVSSRRDENPLDGYISFTVSKTHWFDKKE